MKNFQKIILVLFLGVWTSNYAASELNRVVESTDDYVVNDCSFEEKILAPDMLYFIDFPLEGTLTISGCTMAYDVIVSVNLRGNVTRVRGNLSFSGSCSGSVDFDLDLRSNSDGTINEFPVIYDVNVNNQYEFEQSIVREINLAITNN